MKVFVWRHGIGGLEPQVWDADMMKGAVSRIHGVAAKIELSTEDEGLSLRELAIKYANQAGGAIHPKYRGDIVGFENNEY